MTKLVAGLHMAYIALRKDGYHGEADCVWEAIEKLNAVDEEIWHLRKGQQAGDAACRIVAELVALIPLKDTIAASADGNALVEYFRNALRVSDGSPQGEDPKGLSPKDDSATGVAGDA